MNADKKREREKKTVTLMIRLYCQKNHGTRGGLFPECRELADYAAMRSDKCPFMESKTFCSNCKVHCYKPEMREKIRMVMRFFRAANAVPPSHNGNSPCHRKQK